MSEPPQSPTADSAEPRDNSRSSSAPSSSPRVAQELPWEKKRRELQNAERGSAKIYQLAFWPDDKRAMPADFIACALFAGIQEKHATYVDGEEIANANGLRIIFKGNRLTQVHADVWQGIVHLARQLPEGSKVRFRARPFLRLIGRHDGKKQRDDLKSWFTDLTATSVEIADTKNKRRFWGSLLPNGASQEDDDDTSYVVEINRELAKLFANNLGAVNWNVRRKLFKKPLAQWWHFYASKFDKPVSVAELHRLSGSSAPLKEFRRKLALAMHVVEQAGGPSAYINPDTDTAEQRTVKASLTPASETNVSQQSLPIALGPQVSDKAIEQFHSLYPAHQARDCLTDFHTWLRTNNLSADRPDKAFLGFAKKWTSGRSKTPRT